MIHSFILKLFSACPRDGHALILEEITPIWQSFNYNTKKVITQNSFFTDLQYNIVFKHDKVIKTPQRFPVLRFYMSITDIKSYG